MKEYLDVCLKIAMSGTRDYELFKLCVCGIIEKKLRGRIISNDQSNFISRLYTEYGILFDECLSYSSTSEIGKCVENTIELIINYILRIQTNHDNNYGNIFKNINNSSYFKVNE